MKGVSMERLTCNKLKTICDGYFVNLASKEEATKYRILAETAPKYEEIYRKLAEYEDAEEQGLILRLPCAIGGTVWGWEYPTRIDEEDGSTWTICDIRRAIVVPKKFNLFMLDKMGESYFATKEEAEQALEQMKAGVENEND